MIDDGRNPPVRIDLEIPRLFLLALVEVDAPHLVRQLELFERDGSLPTIRRRRREQFDHDQGPSLGSG